jgi:hypothetical protein
MEALRIYKKPEKGVLTINLPENLAKSKELEVIIIPVDNESRVAQKQFRPQEYFGVWKNKNIDQDKVCKEMRDEWNRGF